MTDRWVTRGMIGIVLATFFSDVGHEMVTAVLPLFLASAGLGAAALGVMEGLADLCFSLSKLAGGWVGHHARRKRPWATAGYLVTTLGSAAMGLVQSVAGLVGLRAAAWFGRGFRSPLRDFLLADEVGPTHFGRAYGVERAADMLGAVAGPLLAAALVWAGVALRSIVLISLAPALLSVAAIWCMTRDRAPTSPTSAATPRPRLPARAWWLLAGVLLFGMGDFSRTFLILLAARALGGDSTGALSTAVLVYAAHNAVSAVVAYPAGSLGDRHGKAPVLLAGYAIGVVTNLVLAARGHDMTWLWLAIVLSGVYMAVQETLEKATFAEILPRELRSLGFGVLAAANALGDLVSSLVVGGLLDAGRPQLAFVLAASAGAAGTVWVWAVTRGASSQRAKTS